MATPEELASNDGIVWKRWHSARYEYFAASPTRVILNPSVIPPHPIWVSDNPFHLIAFNAIKVDSLWGRSNGFVYLVRPGKPAPFSIYRITLTESP